MTFDIAVDAAKTGLLITRPGLLYTLECVGWDPVKKRLYSMDQRGHKSMFHAVKADRESTDWSLLSRTVAPR